MGIRPEKVTEYFSLFETLSKVPVMVPLAVVVTAGTCWLPSR